MYVQENSCTCSKRVLGGMKRTAMLFSLNNNNNVLLYVLFLQTGAYSSLRIKEPKHSQNKLRWEHTHTHTHTHIHRVHKVVWRGEISKMRWDFNLKPVLNWVNVCSPNILWTVWRTMIRFLIELLVRWTWFGQFDELYFVLNWLVMRCKLRPELAADAQQTA